MPHPITSAEAETLALRALAFLAAEPERLEPFLAATGLGPAHLCAIDSLLLEFAGNLSLNPEIVGQARELLAGPPEAYEP